MKRIFTSIVAVAALAITATPVRATTFPGLTLIYAASGVTDSGSNPSLHVATSVHCTNLSGQSATARWVFLNFNGVELGTVTQVMPHRHAVTASTQNVSFFTDLDESTGGIFQGTALVYSTQSGVYCSAMIVDPTAVTPQGVALHMVRYNAHPGTLE